MKDLSTYIIEARRLSDLKGKQVGKIEVVNSNDYKYYPRNKKELKKLVDKLIEERGYEADLNDIDTSVITDMSDLFRLSKFDGDISKWDVSRVKDMYCMFYNSKFNGDISGWDVRSVTDMEGMCMGSPLENNPPQWYKE